MECIGDIEGKTSYLGTAVCGMLSIAFSIAGGISKWMLDLFMPESADGNGAFWLAACSCRFRLLSAGTWQRYYTFGGSSGIQHGDTWVGSSKG